jgi:hypothetical protein
MTAAKLPRTALLAARCQLRVRIVMNLGITAAYPPTQRCRSCGTGENVALQFHGEHGVTSMLATVMLSV